MNTNPLHTTSLLDALDASAREEFLAIAQPVSFLRGSVLLKQGTPTRGAFFIQSGSVDVSARLAGGNTLPLAHIEAGGVLGEMALLEHGLCSATVTASEPVDGLFIGRDDFRVLVARRSAAALSVQQALTANLCAKLTSLNAKVVADAAPEDRAYHAPPPGAAGIDPLVTLPHLRQAAFAQRRFLPVLPLFREWEAEEIDELADLAPVLQVARGQALFYEGMPATACYITVRGAIEISAPVSAGTAGSSNPTHLRRLAILGPGQLIGYRSLIDGSSHAARAVARENSVLLELPRQTFDLLMRGNTPAAMRLQSAVHSALLASMAHTNVTLTRLIKLARVRAASAAALEAALAEQAVYAS